MTDRYLLVRKDGQPAQMPVGDSLRLRGALNEAVPTAYTLDSGGALNWDVIYVNTAISPDSPALIKSMSGATNGAVRRIIFGEGHSIAHTDGVLELPGKQNITAKAGDSGAFVRRTALRWQCVAYQRADGTPLVAAPDPTKLPLAGGKMTGALNEAVPTAATLDFSGNLDLSAAGLSAANTIAITAGQSGDFNAILGATGGEKRTLIFKGAMTISPSTRWRVPGNVTLTTANNDVAEVVLDQNGLLWRFVSYTRADGTAIISGGGTGGSDKSYTYTQSTASSTWTIPHNLAKRPSVSVVDAAEAQVWADVSYVDENIVQVSFSTPFAGKAYLN